MGNSCVSIMKLNMSCPTTGMQKCVDIDDDKKLLPFFDKRMAQEVAGDALGDEFKGYRFRISRSCCHSSTSVWPRRLPVMLSVTSSRATVSASQEAAAILRQAYGPGGCR